MILELTIISWIIAFTLFVAWRRNSDPYLVYAHLVFLISPVLLWAKSATCQSFLRRMLFGMCSMQTAELIMYLIPLAIIISFVTGYFVMPVVYKIRMNAKYFRNFKNVPVYLIDSAKPLAFAIRNKIFISVGMYELLTKKEIESVLLHELCHVKSKSSWQRFADSFIKIWSPFSYFSLIDSESKINKDEMRADAYAIKMQKTSRYINSARNKLEIYSKL